MTAYHIGMTVPPAHSSGVLFATEIDPTCLVGEVRAGSEYLIRDRFQSLGVPCFFPGKIIVRHRFGRRFDQERATVTGYLFMELDRLPDVLAMRARVPGFYRFATSNGRLIMLDEEKMAEMRALTAKETALEAAKRDAARVRAGDTATLLETALVGYTVDVLSIHNGEALLDLAFNGRVKVDVASLVRVTPQ